MAAAQWDRLPWNIHFFQRSSADDPEMTVPALQFLEGLPTKAASKIDSALDAVAKGPPPLFSGGGKWVAMRGDMGGIYEVRVQWNENNHRLFCLLIRNSESLGGPSIVCLGGLSKPRRKAAKRKDYNQIIRYRTEFYRSQNVIKGSGDS